MRQSVITFTGSSTSMERACDKADELMNEFISIDDDITLIGISAQGLYADNTFYYAITIAYRSHLDEPANKPLP